VARRLGPRRRAQGSEVIERLQRETLDVVVEVAFKRRVYGGVRHTDRERFRLVGVRDPVTRAYHLYLTNIPHDRLSPMDIAQTYAARWVIELFFRELKSRYRAEDLPSSKRHVVQTFLYAALITLAVSRTLLAALRKKLGTLGARVPDERWAALFAGLAREILKIVLRRSAHAIVLARDLERALRHEAVDPNAGRALLRQRVESGTQYQHRISVGKARPRAIAIRSLMGGEGGAGGAPRAGRDRRARRTTGRGGARGARRDDDDIGGDGRRWWKVRILRVAARKPGEPLDLRGQRGDLGCLLGQLGCLLGQLGIALGQLGIALGQLGIALD
jgi:hypothetical protein